MFSFRKLEINNKNLSALNDTDLQILGIKDKDIRAQMLQEFAELPNQKDHYVK